MQGAVLVTGGAKRIGRAISLRLADEGFPVVVHYRSSNEEARETMRTIEKQGGSAACVGADLGNISDLKNLLDSASKAIGFPITGIINNASLYLHDRLDTMDPKVWADHMQVNVFAPLVLTNSLSNNGGGWIVNILDYKIASPNSDFLSYTISKFALEGATMTLAKDLAPRVRIN
ncbi:MAG: SDR family NAD(P)-dependent oxidoreductase, partial [Candidatus Thermoplasmatota archaeon]|nr:SDR family NAD(P)-dependent oxidoreductase [Candidatus Thermoplasmatota archaeon]